MATSTVDTKTEQEYRTELDQETKFPVTFLKRSKAKTVEHPFSRHDNRHAFQQHGVYFGQGLGKKLVMDERNQHKSDDIIGWSNDLTKKLSYSSTYSSNFEGSKKKDKSSKHAMVLRSQRKRVSQASGEAKEMSKQREENSSLRRFPRKYIPSKCLSSLETSNSWYIHHSASNSYHTPLSILAATQQPFLPSNPWKYSYKQRRGGVGRHVMNQTC